MPTEKRIRADHSNYELRNARVFRARKWYECALCMGHGEWNDVSHVKRGEVYARISETRIPVCSAHFTIDDVVTLPPKGRTAT